MPSLKERSKFEKLQIFRNGEQEVPRIYQLGRWHGYQNPEQFVTTYNKGIIGKWKR